MKKAWSRRTIDRLENGIIVLLVCSALFLVYQSGLVQNFAGQGAGTSGESVFTGVQNTALSRGTPVRLMVQLDDGRYGAQYDQTLVDQLYASGLSELLTDSIEAMESPRTVTQEVWQQGWHCITVWECQLKPKVCQQTLEALEYMLYSSSVVSYDLILLSSR